VVGSANPANILNILPDHAIERNPVRAARRAPNRALGSGTPDCKRTRLGESGIAEPEDGIEHAHIHHIC